MSELSIDDVAARVVAWHNRNPLARRLRPADVGSVGHVAQPFFDPDAPPPSGWEAPAGSLLARAMARARAGLPRPRGRGTAGALRAAFREDFIPPLRPDEVAALAARHGVERDDEPVDAPVRVVMPPPGTFTILLFGPAQDRAGAGQVTVQVAARPVPIATDEAIAVALLVTEWTTQTLHAAAQAQASGTILVALDMVEQTRELAHLTDLPAAQGEPGLGDAIIEGLVGQLGGRSSVVRGAMRGVRVSFPLRPAA